MHFLFCANGEKNNPFDQNGTDYRPAPIANAGTNISTGLNELIILNGRGIDTNGIIIKYEWKFDEGTWIQTSSGDTIINSSSIAKTYVCSLRVTDNDGLTDVDEILIYAYPDTVTDIDGNTYHAIKIGNQLWTVENFRCTHYNNGTLISKIEDKTKWENAREGAYCFYNNDLENKEKYGILYNWPAIVENDFPPNGWHIPCKAEWDTLQQYLIANGYNWDGTNNTNKISKSMASKSDWNQSSVKGSIGFDLKKNNLSGFSALPAGFRGINGIYDDKNNKTFWWCFDGIISSESHSIILSKDSVSLMMVPLYSYLQGNSVRLVKDVK